MGKESIQSSERKEEDDMSFREIESSEAGEKVAVFRSYSLPPGANEIRFTKEQLEERLQALKNGGHPYEVTEYALEQLGKSE